jgi:hypothetical protein
MKAGDLAFWESASAESAHSSGCFFEKKTTFHGSQKVYMYSEKALPRSYLSGARRRPEYALAAGKLHERFNDSACEE